MNIAPAKKFAATPTGSPVPITKYKMFLIATTAIPATGEKISPAINAGTSLKSIFKYGGKNGSGKLKNINTKEMVPSKAKTINLNNLDDDICIIQLPLHIIDPYRVKKERTALCGIIFSFQYKNPKTDRGL